MKLGEDYDGLWMVNDGYGMLWIMRSAGISGFLWFSGQHFVGHQATCDEFL